VSSGIVLSPAVRVAWGPDVVGGGLGVVCVADVTPGTVLASIPKHRLLSVANSPLKLLLEGAGLGDSLGVVVALLHERSLGRKSTWHGYLQVKSKTQASYVTANL